MQISGKMREIAKELELKPTRDFLQGIGKFLREFDDDVWIRYLVKKIQNINNDSNLIVVDDIRRRNEITYLKSLGFVIIRVDSSSFKRKARIEARKKLSIPEEEWEKWANHLTEVQVPELEVDYVIKNDGSLENLTKQIDMIIKKVSNKTK
jgi:dephospho-CoA kinase